MKLRRNPRASKPKQRRVTKIDRAKYELNPGRKWPKSEGSPITYLKKSPLTVAQQQQQRALWLWAFSFVEVHRLAYPTSPDYPATKEKCVDALMKGPSYIHPLSVKLDLDCFFDKKKRG